jgi:cobalt-zinc-cadmium efflux system outer membrane protein
MFCLLACVAFSAATSSSAQENKQNLDANSADAGTLTLKQVLDAAWQRSLESTQSRSRFSLAQAEQAVAQSWLAAAPALSMGLREGRVGAPAASRETELGISLPIWRLGQRAAGVHASQFQLAWAEAFEQAERLRLAGRLREVIAALHLSQAEVRQAERHAQDLRELTQDVERRVGAGDLARSDALAARSDWLAAQAQANLARQALNLQQAHWHALTGLAPIAFQTRVAPSLTELSDRHPELALASATVDLERRRMELALVQRPDSPELTLGMRQERPGQSTSLQNSVVVALRLPLGGQVYQQPRIAAALGDLDIAQTQALRTRERLTAEVTLAQNQLSLIEAQLQAEQERAQLLTERARLIDKSFRAGETALPEMLRALTAAVSAQSAFARQQINQQTAIARLEQALGLTP